MSVSAGEAKKKRGLSLFLDLFLYHNQLLTENLLERVFARGLL